jgi:hypothetical protein
LRTFSDRRLLIDHGVFTHVCNCSAVKLPDGSYYLMTTAYPDSRGLNKPASFRSPDARVWNGAAPHQAQLSSIINIEGYDRYTGADINGVNTVLYEDGAFRLYFNDFKNFGTVWRASSKDGKTFTLEGTALATPHMVNNVKKIEVAGRVTYLMALHVNNDSLWFSLASDGMHFGAERELTRNQSDQDRYIVAVGWVGDGDAVYGVLYGAGPVPSLDRNRIFAKWLQKRVVFRTKDGILAGEVFADGPDRVRLAVPPGGATGHFEVFAEDGLTSLHRSAELKVHAGDIWQLPTL